MTIYLTILLTLFALGYGIFFLFTNISFHSIPDSVWASATLGISGGLVYMAKEIPDKIYKWVEQRYSFRIEALSDSDILYQVLNRWVSSIDNSIIRNNIKIDMFDRSEAAKTITYGSYLFFLDRFTLIKINKSIHDKSQQSFDELSVRIFGLNKSVYIQSIEDALGQVMFKDALRVQTSRWGRPLMVDKKRFDYIFSPQKDRIIQCVEKWKASESIFKRSGIVYKLGILMYGKPGTGKSSFARALATYLNWSVVSINLNSTTSEDLILWMSNIGKNKVVLLEDIDCCTKNREDQQEHISENTAVCRTVSNNESDIELVSLDVLLNVLDGIYSPSNVIFIATTNYIDRLDDAFKRPGRLDCKFEMEELNMNLAIEMCNKFGASITVLEGESYPINQAYLQGKILDNITDYKKV